MRGLGQPKACGRSTRILTQSATHQLASIRSLEFTLRIGSRHFFQYVNLSRISCVIWPARNLSIVKQANHIASDKLNIEKHFFLRDHWTTADLIMAKGVDLLPASFDDRTAIFISKKHRQTTFRNLVRFRKRNNEHILPNAAFTRVTSKKKQIHLQQPGGRKRFFDDVSSLLSFFFSSGQSELSSLQKGFVPKKKKKKKRYDTQYLRGG